MIVLPYGTGHLEFPDLWNGQACLVEPGPFPGDKDSAAIVAQALEDPPGGTGKGGDQ